MYEIERSRLSGMSYLDFENSPDSRASKAIWLGSFRLANAPCEIQIEA
jgi:hypothetical protein